MLSQLNWMSIRQRIYYQQCLMVWKVKQGTVPDYLATIAVSQNAYLTRSALSGNYIVPRDHQRSFKVSGAVAWNTLPTQIKNINCIGSFKRSLVRHIFGIR